MMVILMTMMDETRVVILKQIGNELEAIVHKLMYEVIFEVMDM